MINSKEDFINFYRNHNDKEKWELIKDAIINNEDSLSVLNNLSWKDFLYRNKIKYEVKNHSWLIIFFEENLI